MRHSSASSMNNRDLDFVSRDASAARYIKSSTVLRHAGSREGNWTIDSAIANPNAITADPTSVGNDPDRGQRDRKCLPILGRRRSNVRKPKCGLRLWTRRGKHQSSGHRRSAKAGHVARQCHEDCASKPSPGSPRPKGTQPV